MATTRHCTRGGYTFSQARKLLVNGLLAKSESELTALAHQLGTAQAPTRMGQAWTIARALLPHQAHQEGGQQ